jgi:prophage antirepressor-like protein
VKILFEIKNQVIFMKKIITEEFEENSIRTLVENDEILFVAKDIATALEYPKSSIKQLKNLLSNVPDEWKGLKPIKTLGGNQQMAVLTEQGLYFFVNRSDKPKAIPFQKWVAGEVLPQIRKTGSYSVDKKEEVEKITPEKSLEIVEKGTQLLEKFRDLNPVEQIKLDTFHKNESGESLLEKFGIHFKNSYFLPTELGNFSGVSGSEINLILEKKGFQFRDENGVWKPTENGKEFCLKIGNKFNQLKWRMETILN